MARVHVDLTLKVSTPLSPAGVSAEYLSLDEDAKIALLCKELTSPRPLASPHLAYSEKTQTELTLVRMIASLHARFGSRCCPNYIISNCNSLSDLLEVAILLKEAGLLRIVPASSSSDGPASGAAASAAGPIAACAAQLPGGMRMSCAVDIIPLFETIQDLKAGGESTSEDLGSF